MKGVPDLTVAQMIRSKRLAMLFNTNLSGFPSATFL